MLPFKFAAKGIWFAIRQERSFKIMSVAFVAVLAANIILDVSTLHWIITLSCSGAVLSLEMMNTAVELTIDLVTLEYHPIAEKVKDMAAGSVLLLSIFAAVIGLIIYIPYIQGIIQ